MIASVRLHFAWKFLKLQKHAKAMQEFSFANFPIMQEICEALESNMKHIKDKIEERDIYKDTSITTLLSSITLALQISQSASKGTVPQAQAQ